jgi:gluconate 2-dehydrogenase gamma chain
MTATRSRREFLSSSGRALGAGWLALSLPGLAALSACARDAALRADPFTVLTADEGRTLAALAARIFPSDDELPGAEEAGAVHFADRALESHFPEMREPLGAGLAGLDERARALGAGAAGFAGLPPERQDELIREVEQTEFFDIARMLTVMGTLADASYGGNRNGAAPALLGMQHHGSYQPPFGWYDAEHARENGGAA